MIYVSLPRLFGPTFIDGTDLSISAVTGGGAGADVLREAPLVILDELTAALDAKAKHESFTLLASAYQ